MQSLHLTRENIEQQGDLVATKESKEALEFLGVYCEGLKTMQ